MAFRVQRPSKRAVQAWKSFASGGAAPMPKEAVARPRGKQPETLVNKASQQWARTKGGQLRRNRQGFAEIRPGVKVPFGLGTGTLDLVGPMPIYITQAMVGRTICAYAEIESKTDSGVLAPHQQQRIEELRDMGAMAGCARNVDDCEAIYREFIERALR